MITTVPKPVKLWGRGQMTIPKDVREALELRDESHLSVFVVGRCMVVTPKRLRRSSLAQDVEEEMKSKGLSLEDVLNDLGSERQRYNEETHGN